MVLKVLEKVRLQHLQPNILLTEESLWMEYTMLKCKIETQDKDSSQRYVKGYCFQIAIKSSYAILSRQVIY